MKGRRFIFPLIALLVSTLAFGAAPATQPIQQIRAWFDQLADPNAAIRAKAFDQLIALDATDLPSLQKAVEDSLPLRPSQRAVLREIVHHLFNSGRKYDASMERSGFLGVMCDQAQPDPNTGEAQGVVVVERSIGFPAYRLLRNGDIIVSTDRAPKTILAIPQMLIDMVGGMSPGETVTLRVLREGNVLQIPLKLVPRPAGVFNSADMNAWNEQVDMQFNEYWNKNFRRLFRDELL